MNNTPILLFQSLFILLIFVGLGFIPAKIAKDKGYSFGLWWLYGFLLFIIALIHALVMPRKGITKSAYNNSTMPSNNVQVQIYNNPPSMPNNNVQAPNNNNSPMFCTKCGNKIDEDEKFCSKCGNQLIKNEQTNYTSQ